MPADIGTLGQQMPRDSDDLLRRVKALEQQMQQTTSAAAGAQAMASSLTAILANQVSPDTNSSSLLGYTLTSSYATLATLSFTVPTGFTRALVSAVSSVTSLTNATGGDVLYGLTTIAGSNGPESIALMSTSYPFAVVCTANTRIMTGLSGGSTISVSCSAHLLYGPGTTSYSRAILTAQIIYLK